MRFIAVAIVVVCAVVAACAPPDELAGPRAPPDITTTTRELVVDADIDDLASRTLTLSLDERMVWSCTLERSCASSDVWYQGPGLYTFAMGDDFAADVYVHDEVLRVELRVRGEVHSDGTLELWHVNARAFSDGAGIASLQRTDEGALALANTSGVELMKESMTANLERWDGDAWRDVPRADMFLCGTGWNPRVGVDQVRGVYLPLSAYRRGMATHNVDTAGTYRVRFPFRVIEEEQPRFASMIMELDEQTFGE